MPFLFWIRVSDGAMVKVGDVLAFPGQVVFEERSAISLQIDDVDVELAEGGAGVGVRLDRFPDQVVTGSTVMRLGES